MYWNIATTRTVLDTNSQLYEALCNSNGSKCNYKTIVELTHDLECYEDECTVDTLNLIKIQNSPPLYFEFMPFPCVELAFSTQAKKVVDQYSRAMCADPLVKDVIFDVCCPSGWQGKSSDVSLSIQQKCDKNDNMFKFVTLTRYSSRKSTIPLQILR